MLNKRTTSEIVQSAIRNLVANTDLRFFGSGSISKTIIEAIAREIELLYESIDLNLSQARLSTASGAFLDIIAAQFGLTRLGGTSGSVLAEDQVVRFYTLQGRLIDYIGGTGTSGIISQGTSIYNRSGSVTFTVSQDTRFPADATSVWVPITPSNPGLGVDNNLPAGSLVRHSLGSSDVYVENTASILIGTDPETDEELRLRISRAINSRSSGSRTAVLEAAFSFPGVSDIKIHPYKYGAGSFELLIVPTSSIISANTIANIKSAVESAVPYGIKVGVRGPDIVPISVVIEITIARGTLSQVKAVAIEDVRNALRRYLGNIVMGGELIINRLRSVVMDANNSIRDMNILELNINCKPQVVANYRLREDEVFDLDRKVAQPLMVI